MEKLQKEIKEHVSESEDSESEYKKVKQIKMSMENRMYIDNQSLWNKNQILRTKNEKLNERIRIMHVLTSQTSVLHARN